MTIIRQSHPIWVDKFDFIRLTYKLAVINPKMRNQKEDFKILQNIFKNVNNKDHKCLICDEIAINSHLLQKNGILNLISYNNHIIQIKSNDFFKAEKEGMIDMNIIGINKAMSYPLFCNLHDTKIFESIETKELNTSIYKSQLLFSYRSLCAEIRKKLKNIEIFERVQKSSHFKMHSQFLDITKMQIEANTQGVNDMNFFKDEFEKEIFNESIPNFVFETIDFNFIPISVSAVYSPINPEFHTLEFLMNSKEPLNYIFINLIPQNDKLSLIIGYHKNFMDNWIFEYINSWKNIDDKVFRKKITDLLATKIETWAISPVYFESLSKSNINKFKKYWNENAMNLKIDQKIDFNLFE